MRVLLKVLNGFAAVLSLAVLGLSAYVPPLLGRGDTPSAHRWQIAGGIACGVVFACVVRYFKHSSLFLLFACAFFFVSCSANFRWGGG